MLRIKNSEWNSGKMVVHRLTWAWFVIKVGAASQHGLLVGGCDSADGLVSIQGHGGQEWGR